MNIEIESELKAFFFYCKNHEHDPHYVSGTIHAETRGKALYKFYLDYDYWDNFKSMLKEIRCKRDKPADLLTIKRPHENLTKQQQSIIEHANGNDSYNPGYRNYYCSTPYDPELEALVFKGLFTPGNYINNRKLRYYILTDLGCIYAASFRPIKRAEFDHIKQAKNIEPKGISLEDIKHNQKIYRALEGKHTVIFSNEWGAYWREKGSGYTANKKEAGSYTFKKAFERVRHCGPEKKIELVILDDLQKIKAEDIFEALNATVIKEEAELTLLYYHSKRRGYFLKRNKSEGLTYLGASINQAITGYNKAVDNINKGNKIL